MSATRNLSWGDNYPSRLSTDDIDGSSFGPERVGTTSLGQADRTWRMGGFVLAQPVGDPVR